MHDPQCEKRAAEYVRNLIRATGTRPFTPATVARHLVAFAESEVAAVETWVVRLGNYFPAEIDSVWRSGRAARARLAELDGQDGWAVERW